MRTAGSGASQGRSAHARTPGNPGTLGRRKYRPRRESAGQGTSGRTVSPGQHRGDVVPLGHTGMVFQPDPGAAERHKSHSWQCRWLRAGNEGDSLGDTSLSLSRHFETQRRGMKGPCLHGRGCVQVRGVKSEVLGPSSAAFCLREIDPSLWPPRTNTRGLWGPTEGMCRSCYIDPSPRHKALGRDTMGDSHRAGTVPWTPGARESRLDRDPKSSCNQYFSCLRPGAAAGASS